MSVYMFLAEGFEETEAIGCLDVLRRAEIETVTVGVGAKEIKGSHGIAVVADIELEQFDFGSIEGVILPGGMPGTMNLQAEKKVTELVEYCAENGKLVAAICAAPMILGKLGLLKGKRATCYPGFEEFLEGAEVDESLVAIDGNFVTGKGAGAAMLFGARIADWFKAGAGQEVLEVMQHPHISNI